MEAEKDLKNIKNKYKNFRRLNQMLRYSLSVTILLLMLIAVGCSETSPTVYPSRTEPNKIKEESQQESVEKPNDNAGQEEPVVVIEEQPDEPIVDPQNEINNQLIENLPLAVAMDIKVQNVNPAGLKVRWEPNTNENTVKGEKNKKDLVWDGDIGLITRETNPLLHVIDDRFTWWYVKWDNGKEGWSAQTGLDGTRYLVVKH